MNERSPDRVTLLGRTNFRNEGRLFGIQQTDRLHHMFLIGRTGTGKSTLLRSISLQDAVHGHGFALLDPHGDLAEQVIRDIPKHRKKDLIYFDVPNPECAEWFNPLACVPPQKRSLAASGMLEIFKKLWPDFSGPRSDHLLRNGLLTLLEQPEPTLGDLLRLFDDASYRKRAVGRVRNSQVRRFWLQEFEGYTPRLKAEAVAPLQNKVGAFVTDPLLNRLLTAPRSSFDLREVMDHGKILVVNLSKGRIGADSSALLGSLVASQISLAAMSRADLPEESRQLFHVIIDEFSSFTTRSFVGMLSELRKYACGLTLATQYLGQADDQVRDAILANVGSIVAFRVGVDDAEILSKEFLPEIGTRDLVTLPNHQAYVRLMIKGVISRPFSAETLKLSPGTVSWMS